MAAKKYISQVAGVLTEIQATVSSAGAGDDGKIPALDAAGRLDSSMMPVGIAADTAVIVASEALAAGDLVNVWNSSSTFKVRKADATTSGKEAHGFVLAAVSSSANATVYFEGSNTQRTGLSPGPYWLSTTPGSVTQTPPSGAGNVVQRVGYATSATVLNMQASEPIVLV